MFEAKTQGESGEIKISHLNTVVAIKLYGLLMSLGMLIIEKN